MRLQLADPIANPFRKLVKGALFGATEKGFLFDVHPKTVWQDSAGLQPGAEGQPIGKLLDLSGNENHATASGSARPTLVRIDGRWKARFDGSGTCLVTPTIALGANVATVAAGVYKTTDASLGMILELSDDINSHSGTFYLLAAENNSTLRYAALGYGNVGPATNQRASTTNGAAPDLAVLVVNHDIANDLSAMRRNGVAGTTDGTGDKGGSTFQSFPIYIGARGGASLFFNGDISGACVRSALTSSGPELMLLESFLNYGARAY